MDRARQSFSMLDPTGLKPTGIVIGIILALFVGAHLVNAIIPRPGVAPGPGAGPVTQPGGPGQPLPPITPTNPTNPGNPGGQPLPPGSTLTINDGLLTIPLEAGWQAVSASNNAVASLVKGSVQIDLVSLTIQGGSATAGGVYNGYIGIIGEGTPLFTSSPPATVQIGNGVAAARGSYSGQFVGNNYEGEVTAFVTGGVNTGVVTGWAWDVWAAPGTLGALLPEARRMIDNVRVR